MAAAAAIALLGVMLWWLWDASLAWFSWKAGSRPAARSAFEGGVTVVCCVRNGMEHLPEWVEGARSWGVPVVVVDDGSTDGTAAFLAGVEGVRAVRLEGSRPGKKDAVAAGVAAAETAWVALTDVDCRPGADWLEGLAAAAGEGAEVVVGLSWPTLGRVRLMPLVEAVAVSRRYAAAVGAGRPYMGVGRNMAYRVEGFPGFGRHAEWASGDDDLLVQDWPERSGVKRVDQIRFAPSHAPTFAPGDRRAWRRMKRRHVSTGTAYRPAVVAALSVPGWAALCWLGGTAALWWQWAEEPSAVLHIALWIVHGGALSAWLLHLLTFRMFAKRCGLSGRAAWGGVLQPLVFLEQVGWTAHVIWATRFGLKHPEQSW